MFEMKGCYEYRWKMKEEIRTNWGYVKIIKWTTKLHQKRTEEYKECRFCGEEGDKKDN